MGIKTNVKFTSQIRKKRAYFINKLEKRSRMLIKLCIFFISNLIFVCSEGGPQDADFHKQSVRKAGDASKDCLWKSAPVGAPSEQTAYEKNTI